MNTNIVRRNSCNRIARRPRASRENTMHRLALPIPDSVASRVEAARREEVAPHEEARTG